MPANLRDFGTKILGRSRIDGDFLKNSPATSRNNGSREQERTRVFSTPSAQRVPKMDYNLMIYTGISKGNPHGTLRPLTHGRYDFADTSKRSLLCLTRKFYLEASLWHTDIDSREQQALKYIWEPNIPGEAKLQTLFTSQIIWQARLVNQAEHASTGYVLARFHFLFGSKWIVIHSFDSMFDWLSFKRIRELPLAPKKWEFQSFQFVSNKRETEKNFKIF